MVFDSALTEAKICGDIFIGVASEDHLHNLALSRGKTRDAIRRFPSPRGELARIPRLFKGSLDAGEQFVAVDRLFEEIRSTRLHGLHRHRNVATAGDHDGRKSVASIA